MSILEEFEFDSLPYVDKEFEDPHMQAAVREAIAAEMRRFKPRRGGYISHLPYPSLKRTPSIKSSMQSSPNGDGNIYSPPTDIPAPTSDSPTEWRQVNNSLKSRYEDTQSTLLNMRVADEYGQAVLLASNTALNGNASAVSEYHQQALIEVNRVNEQRAVEQARADQEIVALKRRRLGSLQRIIQVKYATEV